VTRPIKSYLGSTIGSYGWHNNGGGRLYNKNTYKSFTNFSFGDRLMLAYDPAQGQLWLGKNGIWQGDPVAGTGAAASNIQGVQYPAISAQNSSIALIFKPSGFHYAVPMGFEASRIFDADRDGLDDEWELQHFGNLDQLGTDDPDVDGMANVAEQRYGGAPNDGPTDGDQDGWPEFWQFPSLHILAGPDK